MRRLRRSVQDPKPSASRLPSPAVEDLVAQVEAVPHGAAELVLDVADELTYGGAPVDHGFAMALIVDRVLAQGMTVAGFGDLPGGRRYRYVLADDAADLDEEG